MGSTLPLINEKRQLIDLHKHEKQNKDQINIFFQESKIKTLKMN